MKAPVMQRDSFGVIYAVINRNDGKMYIGQTINIKRRVKELKIREITKKSQKFHLLEKIVEEGHKNFRVEILHYCDSRSEMHNMERYFIKKFNTRDPELGYNSKTGGSGGEMTESTIQRMSETTSKFRHSEETKRRKSTPIIAYFPSEGKFVNFMGAKTLADHLGVARTNVTYANKKGRTVKGVYVFYEDIDRREKNTYLITSPDPMYYTIYDRLLEREDVETI